MQSNGTGNQDSSEPKPRGILPVLKGWAPQGAEPVLQLVVNLDRDGRVVGFMFERVGNDSRASAMAAFELGTETFAANRQTWSDD